LGYLILALRRVKVVTA